MTTTRHSDGLRRSVSRPRWHAWCCLLICGVASACVSGHALDAGLDASVNLDAKTTDDGSMDSSPADVGADTTTPSYDAAISDALTDDAANADGMWRDARTDADADVGPPRTPTPACGMDLNIDNGQLTARLGTPLPLAQDVSGDLADPGPYARASSELMIPVTASSRDYADQRVTIVAGNLPATAYLPTGSGPFPLVILLPGFQSNRTLYTTFADHFASWGMIAVGLDTRSDALMASHDKEALEVSLSIDWLLTESAFKERIDATKIAVAGHSKGGKVAFFTSVLDPRVDIVVGWDPVNSGGGPCAFDANCNRLPVAPNCSVMQSGLEHLMSAESLVIGAPPDAFLNPDAQHNCVHFYRGAPSPAWLAVLNVGHAAWAANNDAPEIRLTKRAHIALLLSRFYASSGLDAVLPGGAMLESDPLVARHERK